MINFSCGGAYPDINFFLDIDPEAGLSKISGNEFAGNKKDKIEARSLSYHEKVRRGYLEIAKQNNSFRIIPYVEGKPEEMHHQIVSEVEKFIKENGLEKTLAKTV